MSARARIALAAGLLAALAAALLGRRQAGRRASSFQPAEVNILPGETVRVKATGPARSVQKAEIIVSRDALERVWAPDSLELLARGYWAFLRRISLGLIRVVYADDSRTVTILNRIPLLRFGAPQYEAAEGRGRVSWPVVGGLLVAHEGRGQGHLRVEVERCDRDGTGDEADALRDQVRLLARVEVENFYPGLRGSGPYARWGAWFYAQTQLRIHVVVCNAFLRWLPSLHFADLDTTSMPSERAGAERVEALA